MAKNFEIDVVTALIQNWVVVLLTLLDVNLYQYHFCGQEEFFVALFGYVVKHLNWVMLKFL